MKCKYPKSRVVLKKKIQSIRPKYKTFGALCVDVKIIGWNFARIVFCLFSDRKRVSKIYLKSLKLNHTNVHIQFLKKAYHFDSLV